MDRKALVGFRQRLRGTALYEMSGTKERLCAGCQTRVSRSLLYVGMAPNPLGRLAVHCNAEWAADVTHVRIDWYPTRRSAFEAAVLAIAREEPYYNLEKRYPPRRGTGRMDAAVAVYRLSCNPEPLCARCRSHLATSRLYLGVSDTPLVHIRTHARKEWAAEVTQITIKYYPNRRAASQAARRSGDVGTPSASDQLSAWPTALV